MTSTLIIAAIALSLIIGAAWGLFLPLPARLKGNAMAFGGGALLSSLVLELFVPAINSAGMTAAATALLLGALVFSVLDHVIDEVWTNAGGIAVLAAISLDGIPENFALGAEMAQSSGAGFSALAGAIFLSNLPEAAAGAHSMRDRWSRRNVMALWSGTALVLSGCTLAGRWALTDVQPETLSLISAFAGGAVIASLVTEIFPQAHREDDDLTGLSSALGVICATMLSR